MGASADLVVDQDLHHVRVVLKDVGVLRFVGQQDKLDPQKRNKDEGGSDSPHVQTGLSLVGHPQFGDQNPNDVEQKEEIYLDPPTRSTKRIGLSLDPIAPTTQNILLTDKFPFSKQLNT